MIDIRLKTLLTVMKVQNFSKAAQVLSLTQLAASHPIRSLEEETGNKLLIRKNIGISILTKRACMDELKKMKNYCFTY